MAVFLINQRKSLIIFLNLNFCYFLGKILRKFSEKLPTFSGPSWKRNGKKVFEKITIKSKWCEKPSDISNWLSKSEIEKFLKKIMKKFRKSLYSYLLYWKTSCLKSVGIIFHSNKDHQNRKMEKLIKKWWENHDFLFYVSDESQHNIVSSFWFNEIPSSQKHKKGKKKR